MSPVQVARCDAESLVDLRWAVLRAGRPRETARFPGDDAPGTLHWCARASGRVLGCVTVLARPPEGASTPRWQLRGMATDPSVRGAGVGALLLHAVHAEVGEAMWCNARIAAAGFYARHGWTPQGEAFDLPPIGPHRRMVWPGPVTP